MSVLCILQPKSTTLIYYQFSVLFLTLQIQQLLCYKQNLSLVLKSWVQGIKAFKTLKQLKETPLVCQILFTFTYILLLGTYIYGHTTFST